MNRKPYPRFTLCRLRSFPAGPALSLWWRDLKLGWKIDGWRTSVNQ